ncbi:MAG: hypothetical protein IKB02_01890 [Clostridia bacterium]|nr:hypothetical protein [Clostridia bacterium]
MKKLLAIFLAVLLCVPVFSGCTYPNGDVVNFSFGLLVGKKEYLRGETIEIKAVLTNVSGKTYRYMGCSGNDFIPLISLYNNSDGEEYYLECDPIVLPEDVKSKSVKNGESGSEVYTFLIPDDARIGYYDVTLFYGDETREFLDVLSISDATAQNENDEYGYSSAVISCGEDSINPIRTLVYTNEFAKDGTPLLCGDGDGAYRIFSNPKTKLSELPTIVANGEVTLTPPKDSKISSPRIYKTNPLDYNEYEQTSFEGLHLLPVGEYVVVFSENTDSRNTNPDADTYWISQYEQIFRLIVPARELGKGYYSLTFNQTYSLADDFDLNTKYRAGERVELKLETVFEQYYEVSVNGEKAVMTGGDFSYATFVFIMPEGEAHVEIKEISVEIPRG